LQALVCVTLFDSRDNRIVIVAEAVNGRRMYCAGTMNIFVTGTDTGIGKTVFAAGLARHLDVSYWFVRRRRLSRRRTGKS